MSLKIASVLSALVATAFSAGAVCDFSWGPHSSSVLSGVDKNGALSISQGIGDIELSSGEKIEIFAGFCSMRKTSSPLLGPGWWFNLTDFTVVRDGANSYSVRLPSMQEMRLKEVAGKKNTYESRKASLSLIHI